MVHVSNSIACGEHQCGRGCCCSPTDQKTYKSTIPPPITGIKTSVPCLFKTCTSGQFFHHKHVQKDMNPSLMRTNDFAAACPLRMLGQNS